MDLGKLETRELGKFFEQLLVSKLIKLKIEVFIPVIDKGIDFILRKSNSGIPKYFEVQVKSVRKRGGRLTIKKETFPPDHENLFLIFFNVKGKEDYDAYVIPSKEVSRIFRNQEQSKKPIYRLYTSKSDLRKIRDYEWDLNSLPEVWKN